MTVLSKDNTKTNARAIAQSPIGKKLITGITGLGLALFVLAHMVGNLLMFVSHDAYNRYGRLIERLGPLFWLVELVLLGVVLTHAAYGIQIFWGRRQARPIAYAEYASRGEPSVQSLSSRTMIVTGSVLGIFLVSHLLTFKFGPYFTTTLQGKPARDLARLVIETFRRPLYTAGYTVVVVLLGFHLRHGMWSALQSLGAMSKGAKPLVYGASLVFAGAIAIGFLLLPWGIAIGWVQ
ncbi:MAG: succinate dehydrogenase cytochrome b subunit [Leptolyngbya sp. RL_3_1]|nr:succinate dehydrogenase cytochrome b subunit [Leptolyngbya sp. RL_3_1]